jgi:hypothetical protein
MMRGMHRAQRPCATDGVLSPWRPIECQPSAGLLRACRCALGPWSNGRGHSPGQQSWSADALRLITGSAPMQLVPSYGLPHAGMTDQNAKDAATLLPSAGAAARVSEDRDS